MACGVTLKRHQDCLDPAGNSLGPLHMSPKRQRISPHPAMKRSSPASSITNSPSASFTREPGEITEDLIDAVAFEAKRLIHSSSPRSSVEMQPSHSRQNQPTASNNEHDNEVDNFVKSFFFQGGFSGAEDDRPVFNMKQVVWICAKLLKQREEHIRQEYNKILQGKLAEQQETFIRWTQDELHRKFHEGTPSYVS